MLVRLSCVTPDVLRDLLGMAHKFVTMHEARHSQRFSFCERMPVDDLWKVADELRERCRMPAMTDDFDDRWLPFGYHDGDWPDWPEQQMEYWLPPRICAEYGKSGGTLLNGDFLVLDVTRTEEIVRALESEGFQLRQDPRLVRRACGRWVVE